MATMGERLKVLREFLEDSFHPHEFETFLYENDFAEIIRSVSGSAAGTKYFSDAIQAFDRHGLINGDFFDRLANARPAKTSAIKTLASVWVVAEPSGRANPDPPRRSMAGHHFISYSGIDAQDFALRLHDALEGGTPHVPAWLDRRDIAPGQDGDAEIEQAIRDCTSLLFVMSEDSVADGSACKLEWTRALSYKKPIVPLRYHRGASCRSVWGTGNRSTSPAISTRPWRAYATIWPGSGPPKAR